MQVMKNILVKTDAVSVVIPHVYRDLDVQPVDINASTATKLVILVVYVPRQKSLNTREIQDNLEHIN